MEPRPIFWILLACLLFWILVVDVVTGHSQGLSSIEVWNRQAEIEAQKNVNVEKLADAIYIAEGGDKTKYPYGILTKYKTTTPRQARINTINHALRDWDRKGDFIEFLGSRYCPVGAGNDPKGLNKNWVRNVKYYYNK